jgi:hypothetical protein
MYYKQQGFLKYALFFVSPVQKVLFVVPMHVNKN